VNKGQPRTPESRNERQSKTPERRNAGQDGNHPRKMPTEKRWKAQ
jgi:hypothetical protein